MSCSSWFDCADEKKRNLSLEQVLRMMIVADNDGCPQWRGLSNSGGGGGGSTDVANSALSKFVINNATAAGADSDLATWMGNNPSKVIVHIITATGNDGVNTITILYK
jgi:hypothetical protein